MIGLTGSSGFIGSHLLRRLVADKKPVKILCRNQKENLETNNQSFVSAVSGDLLNSTSLGQFCHNVSMIIHVAGIVKGAVPGQVIAVNRDGTENLLKQAEKQGVRRFIYVSSGAVDWLTSEYAQSKVEAESLVRKSQLDWLIIRPSEIYGPGDRVGITSLVQKVKQWPLFPIIGSGSYTLQPLLVHDLVEALETCIDRFELCQGRVLHLAGPTPLPFRQVVEGIGEVLQKKVRIVSISSKLALVLASMVKHFPGLTFIDSEQIQRVLVSKQWDISQARRLLDFEPTPFLQGIRQVIEQNDIV